MPAGKPRKFQSVEELQNKVDDYFQNPPNKRRIYKDSNSKEYTEVPLYGVCGLAYHLGFLDRQSIYDYIKRDDEYSCIIKKAKLFIESEYEVALRDHNVAGIIFALKNMGWRDTQNLDIKSDGLNLVITREKKSD